LFKKTVYIQAKIFYIVTQPKTSASKKAQRSSAVLANINFAASLKQKTQLQQERQKISQRRGKEFDEQFELDKKKVCISLFICAFLVNVFS
jgi:hypothetical protein